MIKKAVKKSDGNVFKTVVRGVVREEFVVVGEQIKIVRKELREGLRELGRTLDEKLDVTFRKYRDDVLTKVENLESIHPQGQHPK